MLSHPPPSALSLTDENNSNAQQSVAASEATPWTLAPFALSPNLSYGNVRIGHSKTLAFRLVNPNPSVSIAVSLVERNLWQQLQFHAICPGDGCDSLVLEPNSATTLAFRWTPLQPGNVRAVVHVLVKPSGQRFSAHLVGHAVMPVRRP
jgi:hypothetical protein